MTWRSTLMIFGTLMRQLMGWLKNTKMLQTPKSTKTTTPARPTATATTTTKTVREDHHDGKWDVARIWSFQSCPREQMCELHQQLTQAQKNGHRPAMLNVTSRASALRPAQPVHAGKFLIEKILSIYHLLFLPHFCVFFNLYSRLFYQRFVISKT